MPGSYKTSDRDTVDDICFRYYGDSSMTEAVLEANRGLADYGAELPSGVMITLPDKASPSAAPRVKLWD